MKNFEAAVIFKVNIAAAVTLCKNIDKKGASLRKLPFCYEGGDSEWLNSYPIPSIKAKCVRGMSLS